MLNRPSANSATHPSQIFLRIHPCSNNSKTRLEAFVYALTWNGLGLDFLRDSTKPFGSFSDSFTQVAKWKRKRLLPSPKNLFMKPTPFFRHFAICEYAKQAHISGYSHQNTFCGACANKMPICFEDDKYWIDDDIDILKAQHSNKESLWVGAYVQRLTEKVTGGKMKFPSLNSSISVRRNRTLVHF